MSLAGETALTNHGDVKSGYGDPSYKEVAGSITCS